jgi:hypothetical protein
MNKLIKNIWALYIGVLILIVGIISCCSCISTSPKVNPPVKHEKPAQSLLSNQNKGIPRGKHKNCHNNQLNNHR